MTRWRRRPSGPGCGAWLTERAGTFPTSGDEYWARQGEWHRALYAGGFFGLSWPREYGGQQLPPVYDVILDEELARGRAAPASATWSRGSAGTATRGSAGTATRSCGGGSFPG